MYPPKFEVRETISNPFEPVLVMGFKARNTIHGEKATIIKLDSMIEDESIDGSFIFPEEVEGDAVVLGENKVWFCHSSHFDSISREDTASKDGKTETVTVADDGHFNVYERNEVEVSA